MAEWIKQVFHVNGCEISLEPDMVRVKGNQGLDPYGGACLNPTHKEAAHELAMVLRKAARRLEEIGKGLSNGRE